MKRLVVAVASALITSGLWAKTFAAEPAKDPYAAEYAAMAGVILFAIDKVPQVIVLVGNNGSVAEFSAEECGADKECITLVARAVKDHKSSFINVTSGVAI